MKDFTYLHSYSAYSILKSGMSVNDYVLALEKIGVKKAGLSDLSFFYGQPHFFNLARKHNITPLLGIDIIYEDLILTFYPKNEEGYKALIAISKQALENNLVDQTIKANRENLILIIGNNQVFTNERFTNEANGPRNIFKRFALLVDDFFIGLELDENNKKIKDLTRDFARKYDYKLVAFPHVKYVNSDDAINQELAKAIASSNELGTTKTMRGTNHLYTLEQLEELYTKEECENTIKLAQLIDFELDKKRGILLKFPLVDTSSKQFIKQECDKRLSTLNLDTNKYRDRLAYELKVIDDMGYNDYFLIVSDFVKFAKNNQILVGPGRGSAAGSLVAFLLDITTIDPLKYDLLFERFLNPARQTMPDIDIDFMDVRRDEVVHYLKRKYGENNICNIVTFQTNAARQSIRDIGRIYNIDLKHINLLTKSLGTTLLNLRDSYRKIKSFKTLVDSDPFYLEIIALAAKIEGFPRQTGMHAAGLILNNEPLINSLPIFTNNGINMSQYEMEYLEAQGFLKMDLLGLTNLTTIANTLNLIEIYQGIKINYEDIPFDDPQVFATIASEKTMGIFQLESGGMLRAIRQIQPTEFNDIVAVLALFRPGPMENIPLYAQRKLNDSSVKYLNEEFKKILAPTYGIIVYQEQIMQIVRVMAGFSYAEADLFRRAISKKDEKQLERLKKDFISGSLAQGYSLDDANKTFADIHKFADYGFNKSHSVAYAKLACQMAYLKTYYPLEFYAAILDKTTNSDTKFPQIVSEMKQIGLKLLLPCVNESSQSFVPKGKMLRLPLSIIKGISNDKAQRLLNEREKNGKYLSLANFLTRMNFVDLSKNDLRLLCEAGALDAFKHTRNTCLAQIDNLDLYKNYGLGDEQNYLAPIEIEVIADDQKYRIAREVELIGLALSDNPLKYIDEVMKKQGFSKIINLNQNHPKIYGYIKAVKTIKTKKGDQMAFLTLSDYENEIDVTLFPNIYARYFNQLDTNRIIAITGLYQVREQKPQIVANEIVILEEN